MAIVSNWDDRLKPLMSNLKLAGYFDTIINSSAVAFHKPCQVIFEMAVRRLGLPPEEILHVGDHFREDWEGARTAGLQAVQLVRGLDHQARAPYQIASLLEVPQLVASAGHHLLASRV
jgi:putative hydrolase of the HAD superfamily